MGYALNVAGAWAFGTAGMLLAGWLAAGPAETGDALGWLAAIILIGASYERAQRIGGWSYMPPMPGILALPLGLVFGWLVARMLVLSGVEAVREPAWALPAVGLIAAAVAYRILTTGGSKHGGTVIAGHVLPPTPPVSPAPAGRLVIVWRRIVIWRRR
jgi:hypothetical protein